MLDQPNRKRRRRDDISDSFDHADPDFSRVSTRKRKHDAVPLAQQNQFTDSFMPPSSAQYPQDPRENQDCSPTSSSQYAQNPRTDYPSDSPVIDAKFTRDYCMTGGRLPLSGSHNNLEGMHPHGDSIHDACTIGLPSAHDTYLLPPAPHPSSTLPALSNLRGGLLAPGVMPLDTQESIYNPSIGSINSSSIPSYSPPAQQRRDPGQNALSIYSVPRGNTLAPQCDPRSYHPENYSLDRQVDETAALIIQRIVTAKGKEVDAELHDVLKIINVSISIDNFFSVMYRGVYDPDNRASPIDKTIYDAPTASLLQILKIVSQSLRVPACLHDRLRNFSIDLSVIEKISPEDIFRTLLAIKILQVLIVSVPPAELLIIPRGEIHKIYCLICHKLEQSGSDFASWAPNGQLKLNLHVGQSKLGKIMKQVYPNTKAKRIGQRGSSKYHYVNMAWNERIVDKDILNLATREVAKLQELFPSSYRQSKKADSRRSSYDARVVDCETGRVNTQDAYSEESGTPNLEGTGVGDTLVSRHRELSFVGRKTKFPSGSFFKDCDFSHWFRPVPERVDQTMRQSLASLLSETSIMQSPDCLSRGFAELVAKTKSDQFPVCAFSELSLLFVVEYLPMLLLLRSFESAGFIDALKKSLRILILHFDDDACAAPIRTMFLMLVEKSLNVHETLMSYVSYVCARDDSPKAIKQVLSFLESCISYYHSQSSDDSFSAFAPVARPAPFMGIKSEAGPEVIAEDYAIKVPEAPTDVATHNNPLMMNFGNENELVNYFFKKELLTYLRAVLIRASVMGRSYESFRPNEAGHLFKLIDKAVLTEKTKRRYDIWKLNAFVASLVDDITQKILNPSYTAGGNDLLCVKAVDSGVAPSSVKFWDLFSSFLKDFLALLGELVGLHERTLEVCGYDL